MCVCVCVAIVLSFITIIHIVIGYFKFPKYIGHIEIDTTKIHISIANIYFPHTLIYTECISINLSSQEPRHINQ